MEAINIDLLTELSKQAFSEMEGLSADQRREVIKRFMVRYHEEASNNRTLEQRIDDVIAPDWHDQMFEIFWNAYNKKVQYAPTLKKWRKLKKKDVEKILETVEAFVQAHPDRTYRPYPLTYINQRRWEDDLPNLPKKQTRTVLPKQENTWSWGE